MQQTLTNLLKDLDLQLVVFDVDDTLVETYNHFIDIITNVKTQLARVCEVTFEEISQVFEELNKEALQLYHVDPSRTWQHIFSGIKATYPNSDWFLIDEYLKDFIHVLYELKIPLKDGVIVLLEAIKIAGIPMGIVTNADFKWTIKKLTDVGILKYFDPQRIVIIPPNEKKEVQHWQQSMHGIHPSKVLALGDNFPVDIKPCIELGAKTIFINNPNHLPESFSIGYGPETKTIRFEHYNMIVDVLTKLKEISLSDSTFRLK